MGDLLFGTLEYQTTIPPKRLMMALCLHMIGFILPKGNTQVYNLPRSLEAMQALLLDAAIPKDILAVALIAHGPTTDPDTYNYYICGFDFSRNNYHDDIISGENALGSLVLRVEAIPWEGDLSVDMASTIVQ
jgi:hypothetical protein